MSETVFHTYRPEEGHGIAHDPFNGIVGPRPIGWISTTGTDGIDNLAPYSFFNALNYKPPLIGFLSTGWKDTVRNIEATGEFVWNLVTRPLAEHMNITLALFAPEIDEFIGVKADLRSDELDHFGRYQFTLRQHPVGNSP